MLVCTSMAMFAFLLISLQNEDADFMTARPPDKQSIRTRATDGDSSQGDHDDSESFV